MVFPIILGLPCGILRFRHWPLVGESLARLYLTGGIRVEGPLGLFFDGDLPGNQGRVAFAALTLERRPLSRDHLADIVSGESLPAQWKGGLTAIVSKIRSLITAIGIQGHDVMVSTGGTYQLVLPPDSWVDMENALVRLDRAEGAIRHQDFVDATREATVSSSILQRPFLSGVDNKWVDGVRRRQGDALHRCLIALAESWNELGDHQLAATIAESSIQLDPLRKIGHRLLIEAEIALGDRGAASRALRRCSRLLGEELGVGVSPETAALAKALRN
jgi:DNA-binding SARP family transcriptional activator